MSRATLHGIHSVFPPPDVLQHEGGRDSISEKKLERGDARFKPEETMLGFDLHGHPKRRRTVGLNEEKASRYRSQIQEALARKGNCVSFKAFHRLYGKVQHAATAMPCMKGFMTPLNRVFAEAPAFVGLGKGSEVRSTLSDFDHLLALSNAHPSHITEIVPPDLPHDYGYVDFAAVGMGGVWLPCTRWLQPLVWRARNPPSVEREVRKANGVINNNDGECAAVVVGEFSLDHILGGDVAGVSSHLGSDNSPTVGQQRRRRHEQPTSTPSPCCDGRPSDNAGPGAVPRIVITCPAKTTVSGTSRPDHTRKVSRPTRTTRPSSLISHAVYLCLRSSAPGGLSSRQPRLLPRSSL